MVAELDPPVRWLDRTRGWERILSEGEEARLEAAVALAAGGGAAVGDMRERPERPRRGHGQVRAGDAYGLAAVLAAVGGRGGQSVGGPGHSESVGGRGQAQRRRRRRPDLRVPLQVLLQRYH